MFIYCLFTLNRYVNMFVKAFESSNKSLRVSYRTMCVLTNITYATAVKV